MGLQSPGLATAVVNYQVIISTGSLDQPCQSRWSDVQVAGQRRRCGEDRKKDYVCSSFTQAHLNSNHPVYCDNDFLNFITEYQMNKELSFSIHYIQVSNFTVIIKYIMTGQLKGYPVIIPKDRL